MPWLGDGTWVQDAGLARSIIHGRTNYRPWSGKMPTTIDKNKPEQTGPANPQNETGKVNEDKVK